ncbi:MAG: hypothetical protein Q9211_001167 [Gyalolechia sp. 1 TL-2023]
MAPQLPPADGFTYKGINGDSNGPRMLVGTWITLSLAIVITLLRMTVKLFFVPPVKLEDYFAIIALLLAIARTALLTMLKSRQYGYHIWDIEESNIDYLYTRSKGATVIYLVATICAKLSILLLYKRLFGVSTPFRYVCHTLMAVVISYGTAVALAYIFQCRPVYAGWDWFYPGNCVSLHAIAVATGALNIATDFAIVVVPIPLVLRLQLKPAKLVSVLAIFSTGILCVPFNSGQTLA